MLITKFFGTRDLISQDTHGIPTKPERDAVDFYEETTGFKPESSSGLTASEFQTLRSIFNNVMSPATSAKMNRFAANAPVSKSSTSAAELNTPSFWHKFQIAGNFYACQDSDAKALVQHISIRPNLISELALYSPNNHDPFILTPSEKHKIRSENTIDPESLDQTNVKGINLDGLLRIIAHELKSDFLLRITNILTIHLKDRSNGIVPGYIITAKSPFTGECAPIDSIHGEDVHSDEGMKLFPSDRKTFIINRSPATQATHIIIVPLAATSGKQQTMYVAMMSATGNLQTDGIIPASLDDLATFAYDQALRRNDPEIVFNGSRQIFI